MPIDPNRLRNYRDRAGLTDATMARLVGTITVQPENIRVAQASDARIEEVVREIRALIEEGLVITAMYNSVAKETQRDPREAVSSSDLNTDRASLEEMFADEYLLTDPLGNVVDKAKVIDNILGGKVLYDAFDQGGFESTEGVLQVHDHSAVLTGEFIFAGLAVPDVNDPHARRIRRSGTVRSTHTYVFRDGRWQLTVSHLVNVPDVRRDWVLG